MLASYDTDTVNKATYAVTVEQEGGSPTGVATGADRVYRQADRERAAGACCAAALDYFALAVGDVRYQG